MEDKIYFYTTHKIHQWTSGPSEWTNDPDNHFLPIESLELAKELAEANRVSANVEAFAMAWQ